MLHIVRFLDRKMIRIKLFLTKYDFNPRGCGQCEETFLVVTTQGGCCWHSVDRGQSAAKQFIMHRTTPHNKEYLAIKNDLPMA